MGERVIKRSIKIVKDLILKSLEKTSSRINLLITFSSLIAAMVFGYLAPIIFGWAVDLMAIEPGSSRTLMLLILSYCFCWMFSRTVQVVGEILVLRMISVAISNYSTEFIRSVISLPSSFWITAKTGAIIESLFRAQEAIMRIYWNMIFLVAIAVIEIVVSAIIALSKYGLLFGLIFLWSVTLYLAFNGWTVWWFNKEQVLFNQKKMATGGQINDLLSNWDAIKIFGNTKHEVAKLQLQFFDQANAQADFYYKTQLLIAIQEIILSLGIFLITMLSGYSVIKGKITIGEFTTINAYILRLIYPLKELARGQMEFRQSINDLENTTEIIAKKTDIKTPLVKTNLKSPTIEFENVTFYYPNTKIPALNDVSFTISPGTTLGIVGTTGSGKSTIVKLICKLYEIEHSTCCIEKSYLKNPHPCLNGSIKINKTLLNKIDDQVINQNIAVVSQEALLFDQTIDYNVRYGNVNATDTDVIEAIKNADLLEFVMSLPEGLNTKIGQRGISLSGGEKQRISIARALLKNPEVFIFDEATSALDYTTQAQINKNIQKIAFGKTNIIIAHRLALVSNADQIIVLNKGLITEKGSHLELMENKKSLYRKMFIDQGGPPGIIKSELN